MPGEKLCQGSQDLQKQALMWTDGRYHLLAVQEMDMNWTLMKDGLPDTPSQADWLISQVQSGPVGVDPWLMGASGWTALSGKLETVETNLVDIAWAQDDTNRQTRQSSLSS